MTCIHHYGGFLGSSVVKNPGDTSLSSESGRAPGEENGNLLSNILAWEIPGTEELGGGPSLGSQESDTLKPFTVWITTNCGKFLKR